MNWIVNNIQWIMLVCGLLTCTMLYPALAPKAALRSLFGETLEGPLAEVIVRNWGALITLVGAALIYGAYDPPGRPFILIIVSVSKLIFSGLVLGQGKRYLHRPIGRGALVDLVMVVLFILYLVGTRAA